MEDQSDSETNSSLSEVRPSSGFHDEGFSNSAEAAHDQDEAEASVECSGFEVPEIEDGWEMGFDSDEDDGIKTPENHLHHQDHQLQQQINKQAQDHQGLSLPPLVEKSACFESSSPAMSSRRREVYKMPTHEQDSDNSFFLWPVGLMINAISFHFKMIGYTMSIAMLLLNICYSLVTEPIHRTVEAKNKVTGKLCYGISIITHARLILWEAASEIGPMINRLVKKMGYGMLAAAYIFVVMNSLVVPAILIDFVLVSRLVEEPVQIRESLHFDYTQPRPSARVPLFPQEISGSSSSLTKAWTIPKSHRFHITATLSLPESDHNMRLGMFQVTAEILAVDGLVLARFTHPCMLRYQSRPIRYAKTAMLAVPLILGIDVESQTLVLKLVESYEDRSSSNYPGSAKIMLEPRAGFPPGAGLPEIYDAQVLVQSELPPLKSVLYNWKWTCYVWGAMIVFMIEVAVMVCCCRHLLLVNPPKTAAAPHAVEALNGGGADHAESRTVEDVMIRRPSRRKKVSFQDDLPRARAAAAGIGTRPSDIDSFVEKELQALSGTKEKLSSVHEGTSSTSSR